MPSPSANIDPTSAGPSGQSRGSDLAMLPEKQRILPSDAVVETNRLLCEALRDVLTIERSDFPNLALKRDEYSLGDYFLAYDLYEIAFEACAIHKSVTDYLTAPLADRRTLPDLSRRLRKLGLWMENHKGWGIVIEKSKDVDALAYLFQCLNSYGPFAFLDRATEHYLNTSTHLKPHSTDDYRRRVLRPQQFGQAFELLAAGTVYEHVPEFHRGEIDFPELIRRSFHSEWTLWEPASHKALFESFQTAAMTCYAQHGSLAPKERALLDLAKDFLMNQGRARVIVFSDSIVHSDFIAECIRRRFVLPFKFNCSSITSDSDPKKRTAEIHRVLRSPRPGFLIGPEVLETAVSLPQKSPVLVVLFSPSSDPTVVSRRLALAGENGSALSLIATHSSDQGYHDDAMRALQPNTNDDTAWTEG